MLIKCATMAIKTVTRCSSQCLRVVWECVTTMYIKDVIHQLARGSSVDYRENLIGHVCLVS
jgi:hypothetical protein